MATEYVVSRRTDNEENRVICDAVLAQLSDWFGPRETYKDYLDDLETRPVFTVTFEGNAAGIMALTMTSQDCVEIHLMAIAPDHHGNGIGTALVKEAAAFARTSGAGYLTVKTLGPSRDNAAYAKTRGFYAAQGFLPLGEFTDFWGEGYPMQLLCRNVETVDA